MNEAKTALIQPRTDDVDIYTGVNHGGDKGNEPPEFGVEDTNSNCPQSRFCHVKKFQGSDGLHYIYHAEKNVMPRPAVMAIGDKLHIIYFS